MYRLVIGHIVLVVGWRGHDRHKPDRIGAQLLDVIQFLGYPIEIPNPIAIAVVEGLHKNLIGQPCLWPIVLGLLGFNLGKGKLQEQNCQQTKSDLFFHSDVKKRKSHFYK